MTRLKNNLNTLILSAQDKMYKIYQQKISLKSLNLGIRFNHNQSLNNISSSLLAEKISNLNTITNITTINNDDNDNDNTNTNTNTNININNDDNYNVGWTKDYKNLNKLLGIKGINSNPNIDINNIKYLIFSLDTHQFINNNSLELDLFYSLRLVVSDFNNINKNRLYEKIIYNLKNNSSWIKDGGIMNIYYVSSNAIEDNEVKESLKKNCLIPSISEVINLKNSTNIKQLRINIFIFSYDSFFRHFLCSQYRNFEKNNIDNNKLWVYPFLIIEDMNLPTVKYLFKERNINPHGMSITWRHKLSPLEENLSNFLYVTDLNESAKISHLCFSDEVFTSNKLDLKLYKEISLIQDFNFKVQSETSNKLISLYNQILSSNKEDNSFNPLSQSRIYKKYLNIKNSAINPLVIILLKRNYIFELEKRLNDGLNLNKDLLSIYNDVKLQVDNLIKLNDNKQMIIEELEGIIKDKELKIADFEDKISKDQIDLNISKEINRENKINRRIKIKKAKSKKAKNKINKLFKDESNLAKSSAINRKIIREQNLLNKNISDNNLNLDNKKILLKKQFEVKEIIEDHKDKINSLDLELMKTKNNLELLSNEISSSNNITFSEEIKNTVNLRNSLRNKNNLSNNYDFKNNKRKYSTLNNVTNVNKIKDSPINNLLIDMTTNPMFVKINQILNSSLVPETGALLNNKDKQLKIEESLRFFWNQELNQIFKGKKSLFSNYVGINILMSSISKLDKVFNLFKEDKRYLKNKIYKNHILLSQNGIIVSIVLTNIIPHMMKYKSNQNTATLFKKIGLELHSNLLHNEWCVYKKINPKDLDKINEDNFYFIEIEKNKYFIESGLSQKDFVVKLNEILGIISSDDYFKLGCDLSEIISENSDLFKFTNVPKEDNTVQRIVVPGQKLDEQIVRLLSYDMDKMVMISEPNKWDVTIENSKKFKINQYGGYLLNSVNKLNFINESYKNNGKTTLDDNKIIDCINYLGEIPYTINTNVLNHVLNLFNASESDIFNNTILNENLKLNMHPNTKNLFNLNLSKKYGEITDIHTHNSQYYNDKSVITYALMFSKWCESSEDNSLYFNYFIDWRGRLYANSNYLSVQGGNLARSLLMFKKGKILNEKGVEHLKVYTANCFGLDKLAYNKRLDWTNKNLKKILSVPEKIMSENMDLEVREFYNFVLEANEPWLFLSCCIELKNYELDKRNFISRLPVYLDATCSGLQHLSTMINDTNLAKYVNITQSNKEDIPSDVYSHMISFVNKKIQEYIKNDNSLAILENINITRKFIKPGIMTISYGSTSRGIAEQLKKSHFKQNNLVKNKTLTFLLNNKEFNKSDNEIHLTLKQIFMLGKAIHSVLYEVYPNLTILVKYLKDMNKLLKKLKLPTIWLSPGGLIIEQNYAPLIKREIETTILGKRKSISIAEMNRNLTDIRKQNNSIVPNVVHSFDASNIALLVENLSANFKHNKFNLITIHDCFATNANDIDEMILKVKLSFIALYSNRSFIDDYHNFILDFIKKTGFVILEIPTLKGDINTYVSIENLKILIPKVPSFSINKDLRFNILGSQYFIN